MVLVPSAGRGDRGWTVDETTSQGAARVRYEVDGRDGDAVRLSRSVLSSQQRMLADEPGRARLPSATKVEHSVGSVLFASDGVRAMTVEETISQVVGNTEVVGSDSVFSARRVGGTVADLPRTPQGAREALADDKAARAALYDVPPQMVRRLEGLDTEAVLARYLAQVEAEPSEAVVLLKYHLRQQPAALRDVARRLDQLDPGDPAERTAAGFGWAAIAAAGHVQAQAVLGEALAGNGYSDLSQEKALFATLSLARPEPFLLPIVWDLREGLPEGGPHSHYYRSLATNLYGSLGYKGHGVAANTAEVVETLGRRLAETGDKAEKRMMLVALGNVGDLERVLPHSEPYFAWPDEDLRDAAFDTFARVEGEEAFEGFAARYEAELSPALRRELTAVAYDMPATRAKARWAAGLAEHETDRLALERLCEIVGLWVEDHPDDERLARRLLRLVRHRPARKILYRHVAPQAAGDVQ